jgi:hypothetical protein
LLISLSSLLATAVIPPTIYRFITQDWVIAFVDLAIVICALTCLFLVIKHKAVKEVKSFYSVMIIFAVTASIHLRGAEQLIWLYPALVGMFFLQSNRVALTIASIIFVLVSPIIFESGFNIFAINTVFAYLSTIGFVYLFNKQVVEKELALTEIAEQDFLTSVGNRRAFQSQCTAC